jgi:hypothetical protein
MNEEIFQFVPTQEVQFSNAFNHVNTILHCISKGMPKFSNNIHSETTHEFSKRFVELINFFQK